MQDIQRKTKNWLYIRTLQDKLALLGLHVRHSWHHSTPSKMGNYLLVKWEKWRKKEVLRSKPYIYRVEPLNICNLHCPLCETGIGAQKRPLGQLSLAKYQEIVDSIAPYAYSLELYHYGEPFLHRHIFEMVSYAKQKKIFVMFNTHFNHFNEQMADKLVLSGLDLLNISIDGSTQEVYGNYRVGGSLQKVWDNLALLVEAKKRHNHYAPFIIVRMLVNKQNEHQVEELRQQAYARGANLFSPAEFFYDAHHPADVQQWQPSQHNHLQHALTDSEHCAFLWENFTVQWDGGVLPCCWFAHPEHVVGNLFSEPLEKIWNNEAYRLSRRMFSQLLPAGAVPTTCATCKGQPLKSPDFLKNIKEARQSEIIPLTPKF